jgi:hypothetical protein
VVVAGYAVVAFGQGGEKPPGQAMREGMAVEACRSCHPGEKDRPKLVDLSRSCDHHCGRCHTDMEKHHPVGAGVNEKEKVPLPLLKENQVGCISCHDPLSARTDRRSWKSQSLFARWFSGQKIHQTYYLRINNSDGKLCQTCH